MIKVINNFWKIKTFFGNKNLIHENCLFIKFSYMFICEKNKNGKLIVKVKILIREWQAYDKLESSIRKIIELSNVCHVAQKFLNTVKPVEITEPLYKGILLFMKNYIAPTERMSYYNYTC